LSLLVWIQAFRLAERLASQSTTRYHEASRRLMASIESNQLLLAAAAACEDKKAEDIRILALDPAESGLTDYFLICNGTNERQNIAITDEVELRLKREFGVYPNSVEGRRQAEWILMDYVDFIVHVFSPEKRAFYGLERLRKSATTISVAELNAELKAHIAASRKKSTSKKTAEKKNAVTARIPIANGVARKTATKKLPGKKRTASKKTDARPAVRSSKPASPRKDAGR
jgi:ribosome-associated protein